MVERIGIEEGRIFARDEFQRAMDELKAAKILHENGLYYKSISSAYYAVYHSAKALLLLKGIAPKTHEGVERMLSLYYVKTKEIDVKTAKIIGRLMRMREEADYYPETPFDVKDSSFAIREAEEFVRSVKAKIS